MIRSGVPAVVAPVMAFATYGSVALAMRPKISNPSKNGEAVVFTATVKAALKGVRRVLPVRSHSRTGRRSSGLSELVDGAWGARQPQISQRCGAFGDNFRLADDTPKTSSFASPSTCGSVSGLLKHLARIDVRWKLTSLSLRSGSHLPPEFVKEILPFE
jgi:hypothetical protein